MSSSKLPKIRRNKEIAKELNELSKEELIDKVVKLEAHVVQLRNLLGKAEPRKIGINHRIHKQKKFDFTRSARRHVLLHLAYFGWDYHGYVTQEQTQHTIEAELFQALVKTCLIEKRENSNYHRCGRTDKGVSAFGQVISIDLRSNFSEGVGIYLPEGHTLAKTNSEEIPYLSMLNRVLPREIRVIAWSPVPVTFSARFDCIRRTYKYFFPQGDLNIERMQEAGRFLIGEHDFRNFCKMDVGNGVVTYFRNVFELNIRIQDEDKLKPSFNLCELTIVGRAFLWHQIRSIISVLFLVGQGKEEPRIIRDMLDVESNPRKPQYSLASELPLNLFECEYGEADWQYDVESLRLVVGQMQGMWTENAVRASMLREALDKVESLPGPFFVQLTDALPKGMNSRNKRPGFPWSRCDVYHGVSSDAFSDLLFRKLYSIRLLSFEFLDLKALFWL
nr:EOG090X083V [Lepidurus arcticus]